MVTKRIMAIRDRESRWLETVLYTRRLLLLECYRMHISCMIKTCILKILTLKQNVYWNLAEVAERPFQPPKFILQSWKLVD